MRGFFHPSSSNEESEPGAAREWDTVTHHSHPDPLLKRKSTAAASHQPQPGIKQGTGKTLSCQLCSLARNRGTEVERSISGDGPRTEMTSRAWNRLSPAATRSLSYPDAGSRQGAAGDRGERLLGVFQGAGWDSEHSSHPPRGSDLLLVSDMQCENHDYIHEFCSVIG